MKNLLHITCILSLILFVRCNKKFDEPPVSGDPDIKPTLSIQQLKSKHTIGNIDALTNDDVISGVIVADDKSGNFYKQIIIQDSTGGIAIRMDGSNLYVDYPVGRKIFLKLKGLYLGDYNKSIQLGGDIDNSNPSSLNVKPIAPLLFNKYIIKGSLDNKITPAVVTPDDLNDSYQNTLVQLNNYQFAVADTSKTYADKTQTSSAVSFSLKTCSGKSIVLRTSSYSSFAGINVPNGNGSITAIYTTFGSVKQLFIRDTSDVQFTSKRCDAINATLTNISDIRAMFKGTAIALPEDLKIKGIVISDRAKGNINNKNLVLQQGNNLAGITLRFIDTHTYNLGDELEINVSGLSLEEYNGLLEITNVPAENVIKTGTGIISPRVAGITDVLNNFETWESTLITLQNVSITGGTNGTWLGTATITNGTAVIKNNTDATALFANVNYPIASVTSLTAIITQLNGEKELMLRDTSEVIEENTNVNDPDLFISEYIEGSSNNKYLELYNGSSNNADLSKYTLKLYKNGSGSSSSQVKLSTLGGPSVLAAGGVLVLKYTSAKLVLPAGVTAYNTSVCDFNGDDAISLEKNGIIIDIFGEIGTDPGASWTVSGNSKACVDKTLRRKKSVTKGDGNWNTVSNEWDIINTKDDVSDLGKR